MKNFILILFLSCSLISFSQEKDLNFYLEKAKENSPLVKDLSNQIKLNSLDSLLNLATYKPQIIANLNTYFAPVYNGFGYDATITNNHTVSGLIGINKKFISNKTVDSQTETYNLLRESLILNKKIALKDLNKVITSQYITTSANQEQIIYNQRTLDLLNKEEIILKKLTQNSIYKQTDYLIFLSTLKQQELQLLNFKQQYENNIGTLNFLSGETDVTLVNLKKPEIKIKEIQNENKNIFTKQFETDSLKIINQKKLIDNNYKPSLSIQGDAGYLSSFITQGYKNFGVSVGLNLSIPIYDGKQKAIQYEKNETAMKTSLAYKTNFNNQYKQQLLMLGMQLKQIEETEQQLQSQLQIADLLIEVDKKLLLTGDVPITDFVIAIGNIIGINNTISQTKANKLLLINEINYLKAND